MPPMATTAPACPRTRTQQLDLGAGFGLFGRGGEKCAEGDIIGAGFARFHRQMPAVMAGDADNAVWASSARASA